MDFDALFAAFEGKHWILLAAMLAGALVAATKQGWLGAWVASKLPPAARPWAALGLAMLGLSAAEIQAGQPWQKALGDGFMAGLISVFAHETAIEGLRGGNELIPSRLTDSPK